MKSEAPLQRPKEVALLFLTVAMKMHQKTMPEEYEVRSPQLGEQHVRRAKIRHQRFY